MINDETDTFTIQNPSTKRDVEQRDSLLTVSLREHPISWAYHSEYPLVLDATNLNTSWCVFSGQNLTAHATLWPRTLVHSSDQRSIKIGLIGNVATHPDHRGSGFMSALFEHLVKIAKDHEMEALFLWSDLLQFYQKLGFSSIGRETRFTLKSDDKNHDTGIKKVTLESISDGDLTAMLALRPKLEWSVKRSVSEFRALLAIPNTAIFLRRSGSKILSWLAIGKGADLQGVAHEWGCRSPSELVEDIKSILLFWDLPQLILLTPKHLPTSWSELLISNSVEITEHPMALGLPIGKNGNHAINASARGFFWGFDSI